LWSVELYYGAAVDNTPPDADSNQNIVKSILTGNLLISATTLRAGFLTLVNYGGKEFLKQAPCLNFQTIFGGLPSGAIQPMEWDLKGFVGQKVSYPKSYVEFTSAPASATEDRAFLVSIGYSLPEAQEKKESGFSFGKQQ
jgi:hypothetical protein